MRFFRSLGTIAILTVVIFESAYQVEVTRMRRDYDACRAGHCRLGRTLSLGSGRKACSYHDSNAWCGHPEVSCFIEPL